MSISVDDGTNRIVSWVRVDVVAVIAYTVFSAMHQLHCVLCGFVCRSACFCLSQGLNHAPCPKQTLSNTHTHTHTLISFHSKGEDATIRVWDAEDGACLRMMLAQVGV